MRTTLSELAHQADLPPRDVLDLALEAGVSVFWHEETRFTPDELADYLEGSFHNDPVPELQIEMTDALSRALGGVTTISVPIPGESYVHRSS